MKPLLFPIFILALVTSCSKKGSVTCPYSDDHLFAPSSQVAALQDYLDSAGITATRHDRGFFYTIDAPGEGTTPELCKEIAVRYVGKLTDGTVFDSATSTTAVFFLGELISGWKSGLPLIKPGGKIWLYIPPALGYGEQDVRDQDGKVVIPAHSILIFEINLLAVS